MLCYENATFITLSCMLANKSIKTDELRPSMAERTTERDPWCMEHSVENSEFYSHHFYTKNSVKLTLSLKKSSCKSISRNFFQVRVNFWFFHTVWQKYVHSTAIWRRNNQALLLINLTVAFSMLRLKNTFGSQFGTPFGT